MNVYDANTGELLESPDLEAGYLVEGERITGYKLEVMDGTVTEDRPEGLRQEVPVVESCQWYYPKPTEPDTPATGDFEERLSAVEKGVEEAKEGLTAAKIMLGVE